MNAHGGSQPVANTVAKSKRVARDSSGVRTAARLFTCYGIAEQAA